MNTVKILQNDKVIGTVTLSDSEWQSINMVDYIEFDSTMHLMPEFLEVHGVDVCFRMLQFADRKVQS